MEARATGISWFQEIFRVSKGRGGEMLVVGCTETSAQTVSSTAGIESICNNWEVIMCGLASWATWHLILLDNYIQTCRGGSIWQMYPIHWSHHLQLTQRQMNERKKANWLKKKWPNVVVTLAVNGMESLIGLIWIIYILSARYKSWGFHTSVVNKFGLFFSGTVKLPSCLFWLPEI